LDGLDLPIQELIDTAPDGFVVVDDETLIVFANRTVENLFGFEPGELLGKPVNTLIPQRLHEVHRNHRISYIQDPRVRPMGLGLDLVGRRKDGSEFPVEISLSPLRTSDRTLFTAIVRDISERKVLEDERKVLAMELETERERDRIAMDLHDGIMQDIYAATLALELALGSGDGSGETAEGIERVIDQLQAVVRNIRSYIFDLRPREFSGNLPEAVANLAHEFQQNSQVVTEVQIDASATPNLSTSLTVYNIAHESLSNIQRHARAELVKVTLEFSNGTGQLIVADDGVGFEVGADREQSHRGLRNMFSRARLIDAELKLDSSPGNGTRLSLRFPISP
jgi:two-component system CheB/CheR fusion protein